MFLKESKKTADFFAGDSMFMWKFFLVNTIKYVRGGFLLEYNFKDLTDRINHDRFKDFLRHHHLQVSGNKSELIRRIIETVNGEHGETDLTVEGFDTFLAQEIRHGRNRMSFISSFPPAVAKPLKDLETVKMFLRRYDFPDYNFNELRYVSQPDETTLVYLNISENNNVVDLISLCFAKKTIIEGLTNEDGDQLPPKTETDYIWSDIVPDEERLIIKMKQKHSNYFVDVSKTRELYEEISTVVREIFSLVPRTQEDVKFALYRMFKDLTYTAEKPFRERVEPLQSDIEVFATECVEKLKLRSLIDPIDLPYRLFRLLERALIQKDFDLYKTFFDGKRGFVERIAFSDQTGAFVNARSGPVDEGIAVADIYFDTRDTIEDLKQLDKLWVTWFYKPDPEKPVERIQTKFEVHKEHFVLHYLYAYTTKEVEEHVLSNFKHYESLPD